MLPNSEYATRSPHIEAWFLPCHERVNQYSCAACVLACHPKSAFFSFLCLGSTCGRNIFISFSYHLVEQYRLHQTRQPPMGDPTQKAPSRRHETSTGDPTNSCHLQNTRLAYISQKTKNGTKTIKWQYRVTIESSSGENSSVESSGPTSHTSKQH